MLDPSGAPATIGTVTLSFNGFSGPHLRRYEKFTNFRQADVMAMDRIARPNPSVNSEIDNHADDLSWNIMLNDASVDAYQSDEALEFRETNDATTWNDLDGFIDLMLGKS